MSTQYNGQPNNITLPPGSVNILNSTNTSPIVVQTSTGHGLTTGDLITIQGHQTNTSANGTFAALVIDGSRVSLQPTPVGANIATTGNGVGAGTGTLTSLAFGQTAAQPSDGDAENAASVDVMLGALTDRTALLASSVGALRTVQIRIAATDDGTAQTTVHGTPTSLTPGTWSQVGAAPLIVFDNTQDGDTYDIAITGTALFTTNSGTDRVMLSIYAGASVPGAGLATPSRILGSAQTLPYGEGGYLIVGFCLRGALSLIYPLGNLAIWLYATTDDTTSATVALRGDYQIIARQERLTPFFARVA